MQPSVLDRWLRSLHGSPGCSCRRQAAACRGSLPLVHNEAQPNAAAAAAATCRRRPHDACPTAAPPLGRWPASIEGNWSGAERLPGRLRLATKSLFFEPDDVRVPIVRCGGLGGSTPRLHLTEPLDFEGGWLAGGRSPKGELTAAGELTHGCGSGCQLAEAAASCAPSMAAYKACMTWLMPRRPAPRRLPFVALTRLEAESSQAVALGTTHVTRMKANCEDAPYATDKVRRGFRSRLLRALFCAALCCAAQSAPWLPRCACARARGAAAWTAAGRAPTAR
jgi:hypothetical protein